MANWRQAGINALDSISNTAGLLIQDNVVQMREQRMQQYRATEKADDRRYAGVLRQEGIKRENELIANRNTREDELTAKKVAREDKKLAEQAARQAARDEAARGHDVKMSDIKFGNSIDPTERASSLRREEAEFQSGLKIKQEKAKAGVTGGRKTRTQDQLSSAANKAAETLAMEPEAASRLAAQIEMVAKDLPNANLNQIAIDVNAKDGNAISAHLHKAGYNRDQALSVLKALGIVPSAESSPLMGGDMGNTLRQQGYAQ